jgi:hypothetical protein
LAEGIGPDTDSGKEVALGKSHKVSWHDIGDAPFVNLARGNLFRLDQLPEPLRGKGIDFVVISWHLHYHQSMI